MAYINGEEVLFSPQIHLNEGGTEGALLLNAEEKQTVHGEVGFKRDVTIEGNLEVLGEFTKTNVDSLVVKDRFIVCNDGESKLTSGLVIKTGESYTNESTTFYPAYGIILDPDTEIVRLGRGYVTEEIGSDIEYEQYIPEFHFGKIEFEDLFDGNVDVIITPEEGQAISTRNDIIKNGNLVKWDAEQNKMVDAGVSPDNIGGSSSSPIKYLSSAEVRSLRSLSSGVYVLGEGSYIVHSELSDEFNVEYASLASVGFNSMGDSILTIIDSQYGHIKHIYTGEDESTGVPFAEISTLNVTQLANKLITYKISETSTNNYIPTAKAVYDFVTSSLGDISTALDEILELQDFYTGATFDELHEYAQSIKEGE